jgi:hypothetical protein
MTDEEAPPPNPKDDTKPSSKTTESPSRISFPLIVNLMSKSKSKSTKSTTDDNAPDPSWMAPENDDHHVAATSTENSGETTPLIDKNTSNLHVATSTAGTALSTTTASSGGAPPPPPPVVTKPWFLNFIHLVQCFTSLVTAVLMCLEILAFFYLPMTILENFLCAYLILFGVLIIITETNIWGLGTKFNKLLNIWFIRGAFYVFIGIQGLNQLQNAVMRIEGIEWSRIFYRNMITLVSWLMVGIGIVYFCMGVLCLHHLYDKQNAEYQEAVKVLKDYQSYQRKQKTTKA